MKTLFKIIRWSLYLLTLLYIVFFITFLSSDELSTLLNESYNLYLVIQLIHIFLALSIFFIIWSNTLYDKWNKVDQTLIVLFFSIFGIWIWFLLYFKKYIIYENNKTDD